MKQSFRLLFILLCVSSSSLFAQVTTSALGGLVADEKGEALPGATVLATHEPSGTKYGTITKTDGRYYLPNVRVGGPYSVVVTFVGYKATTEKVASLSLGQRFNLNVTLKSDASTLKEVVITGNALINSNRTGAETSIGSDKLRALPTITRSAEDYTRLNPMAAQGGSFAGRNDQFNNYSLDGAIFNNPFGLDAATPGGQTDAQPISLDAIEQISVSIAPYDVTQSGFTGASVNAVTKSGTNKLSGTVFGFTRNQNMIGNKLAGKEITRLDLSQKQYGFSLGGPIVKDKIFFFINAEADDRVDAGSPFVPAGGAAVGANVSRVLASDMQSISDLLKTTFGYETGAFQNFTFATKNLKGIAKLDWNLSKNHKLSATYNFLDATKEKPAHPSAIGRRGPDFLTLQFRNSGYQINNKLNSGIVELKSQFGSSVSNKLQVGYSSFRDARDPFSSPFPVLNIGKEGVRYMVAGHEPFSIHNVLDQDVLQLSNNLNIFAGKHTYTIGASFEKFMFNNSFNLTGYGARVFFPDVDIKDAPALIKSADFAKEVADAKAAFANNNANDTWALAETNLGQLSVYAQDEWAANNKLTLTYGLRIDMPQYFDTKTKIEENIARNCCYDKTIEYYDEAGKATKFDHTVLPDQKPLFSPRLGFNYDVKGDKSQQLRGGTGLFTGRFPFVWVGNQVANPNFFFYCVTDPNFKFPQVWRNNLGYDYQLKNGWTLTGDVVYTKDINAVMVRNYGLKLPTGRLAGADTRPVYAASDRALVFGGATNAYVVGNTNLGYSLNTALQAQKSWGNGMFASLAYNFLDSKDAASIDAEISSDAYDRNPANVTHTNTGALTPSLYGNQHRVVGAFSKKFEYKNNWATTVSLFGEYVKGGRYSYTYAGDLNNDGSGLNDLLFIPTDAQIDQMAFAGDAAAQRSALKSYIAQDNYLSEHRGHYATKYGALAPWYSNWDLRLLQDYKLKNSNTIQLSMDILNVGNLISSNWGVREVATFTGLAQPLAVSVANGVPTYSFDTTQKSTFFINDDRQLSRWRMQIGLRYSF